MVAALRVTVMRDHSGPLTNTPAPPSTQDAGGIVVDCCAAISQTPSRLVSTQRTSERDTTAPVVTTASTSTMAIVPVRNCTRRTEMI